MRTITRCLVYPDTYRDSVELMRVAAEIEQMPGVARAAVLMATPSNRGLLAEAGLLVDEAVEARPNDLVIAVSAQRAEAARAALDRAAHLLADSPTQLNAQATMGGRPRPRTTAEALTELQAANLAIISTPGAYATAETLKALKRGLHVFLFSNNVPIEDEVELKRIAERKGLLLMGPDCGTAILDGVPLGFANAVRRGRIGLVGASGTGLQEVSCLIDRLGAGVSQVIGVGGRDLDERVGGSMMLAAIRRLAADASTAVIVLVSKSPAQSVAQQVLNLAQTCRKPVVVNFLGADPATIGVTGLTPASSLEEAAVLAVDFLGANRLKPSAQPEHAISGPFEARLAEAARERVSRFAPEQRLIRGLYSGGTLCQEAALILAQSREAAPGELMPGQGHTLVDLGTDELTLGRPHPMIDFRLRNERILAAARDPSTAVILLDIVLGYGSHPDPAGALIPAIELAVQKAAADGRELAIIAHVCGTQSDPQDLALQEKRLSAVGVVLAPTNARAARLAALLVSGAPPAGAVPNQARPG